MPRDSERQTKLEIDLGGEQILLERLEAVESLSSPFQITLDIIAPLGEVSLLPHLGKAAKVSILQDGELQRHFHGIVVEGEYVRESSEGFHYTLQLRPWTHFLSNNQNFAIFQDQTALDIIKKVLENRKVDYDKLDSQTSKTKREYTVQYGESDFAFVSRLMEDEGIYYYFEHKASEHTMVLCDGPSSHSAGTPSSLIYNPQTLTVFNTDSAARTSKSREYYMQSWIERVTTDGEAKVTIRDFDFKKPEQPVEAVSKMKGDHEDDSYEVYDYPGGFVDKSEGETYGKIMLESYRADRRTYRGQSQSTGLSCGKIIALDKHPTGWMNNDYMITRAFHSITAERYRSGSGTEEEDFNVVVEAVLKDTKWRAPQVTPRPVVHGLETAIITGPQDEEIYTDEYGRVKVRFPWDRSDSKGEESTCWMRVSQTGGLGNIILPRVGHEVLVDFLGGDPDRPLVVGRVFNQTHMPIYDLPEHKTRALWRTKTYGSQKSYGKAKSLDSGAPKANEIRFEDKGGEEEIFVHAERDMNTRIRHCETNHVGLDQSEDVGNNRSVSITNDDLLKVGNNLTIDVGNEILIKAGAKITITVGASKITMDGGSIKLSSPVIDNKADATFDASSAKSTVKGDGLLVLQGGITKIN